MTGFELAYKRTRNREFFVEVDLVVPWLELVGLIEPHARGGKTWYSSFAAQAKLPVRFMQQWFGLRDLAIKEALHDEPPDFQFALLKKGGIAPQTRSDKQKFASFENSYATPCTSGCCADHPED